ncbi:hypothetical protein [Acinetobacter venetianus]|uniref:hypothetical protein n=1 Tax=Acinetobacter venetianus TaxID=52133 RepID=UPI003A92E74E
MKAVFAGGSHHNMTKEITMANPSMSLSNDQEQSETYHLFEAKNKNGEIFALYKHPESTQKQINEILIKFS